MGKCRHTTTCFLFQCRPGTLCLPDCWLAEKLDVIKLIDDEAARLARELALQHFSKNGQPRQGDQVPNVPE